jgi:predicted phosphate transport protein (TIGR00153 family)
VRLRLFPREEAYFDLFEQAGANTAEAARVLVEMMEDFSDPKVQAKHLVDLEHEGDRITREVVRRLNSSFVTPFDREDIYTLTNQLDDVTDAIEAIGDMLILHRVDEPIEAVRAQARLLHQAATVIAASLGNLRELDREALRLSSEKVQELEDEGDRLYRRTRAELYEFSDDQPHPARFLLLWKDIVEQLEEAMDGLEDVADTLESIVLKYA